jgi:hypothetical protein
LHWTARRYIPEDITLHNHRCRNLTSYMEDNIKMYHNEILCEDVKWVKWYGLPIPENGENL